MTVVLALGLSLAPLPEWLRPIPSLGQGPLLEQLQAHLLPSGGARQAGGTSPDELPQPALPDAVPEEEEEPPPQPVVRAVPTNPERRLPPTLGLDDLGPAQRARALELEEMRERMGARHVDIEPGCRRQGPQGCEESGLGAFFASLESLRSAPRPRPVRALVIGDSLIASDHITDIVRERLQERHGSGGKGLLFVDRPTRSGRGVRAGQATEGWAITRITDRSPPKERLGLTGVAFAAGASAPQEVRYSVEGARYAELFFLAQPGGGSVQLQVDGKPLQRLQTKWSKPEVAFTRVALPEGAQTLRLRSRGKVELHALSLESGGPGVVSDTIGLPGAYAGVYLRAHRPFFRAQLKRRKPALVVLMLGGNEALRLARGWTTAEEIKQETDQLVQWVQESAPRASCLLLSPLDAGVRTVGGDLVPRKSSRPVGEVLREVAQARGCAYWDALTAMGGEGAALRWLKAGLFHEDLIHPRARGSDLLGHLLDTALQRAFAASRTPYVVAEDEPGLQEPKALQKTFARLRALEQGGGERVGVLQLGDMSVVSPGLTDPLRSVLAKRFGEAVQGQQPQLLVLGYGMEEAEREPGADPEALWREFAARVERLKKEAGEAECLLVGPADRLRQREDGSWEEVPGLERALVELPKVAREQGCAWWSTRAAMGGERSMLRWQRSGLAQGDGVHLSAEGQERLARQFLEDLQGAYEAWVAVQPPAVAKAKGD